MESHLYYCSTIIPPRVEERKGPPASSLAAVALAEDGRCVFGEPGKFTPPVRKAVPVVRTGVAAKLAAANLYAGCMDYDPEVERQRRLVCDSALGQLVLDNPDLIRPAMDAVGFGLRKYWMGVSRRSKLPSFEKVHTATDKYITNPTSFGRQAKSPEAITSEEGFWNAIDGWLLALASNDVAKKMSLFDAFLRVHCLCEGEGKTTATQVAQAKRLREDWYDKSNSRGRKEMATGDPGLSYWPGLITRHLTIPWVPAFDRAGVDRCDTRMEGRKRGFDNYYLDPGNLHADYKEPLRKHNLLFSASVSGTTSTLLASAYTFAPQVETDSELKKQYLLGCVAYLVGGGMHTADEVFFTGGKAGLNYKAGKYLDMLPRSFLDSAVGRQWKDEFWDHVRPDRRTPR